MLWSDLDRPGLSSGWLGGGIFAVLGAGPGGME